MNWHVYVGKKLHELVLLCRPRSLVLTFHISHPLLLDLPLA